LLLRSDTKAIETNKEKEASKEQNQRNKDTRNKKNVNANKFVQTQGSIFSEGIAMHQQRRTQESREASDNFIPRPKINNKIEAERITKGDLESEHLVLSNLIGLEAEDEDMKFKDDATNLNPVKIKNFKKKKKMVVKADEAVKDEVLENGNVKSEICDNAEVGVESDFKNLELRNGKSELMIFQLPDSLPGRLTEKDDDDSATSEPAQKSAKSNLCSLESIDEGLIGKIVRYKSGKTKLILGESIYNVQRGLSSDFNQNVISYDTNEEQRSGTFYNLGPIEAKFTVSPDWNWLFQKL
jgi:DNA-directed RNA polymerase III subunit RPC4